MLHISTGNGVDVCRDNKGYYLFIRESQEYVPIDDPQAIIDALVSIQETFRRCGSVGTPYASQVRCELSRGHALPHRTTMSMGDYVIWYQEGGPAY